MIHLRDEVAERDPDRPRQPHGLPVARGDREVAVGGTERRGVAPPDRGDDVVCGGAVQRGRVRAGQINQPINTFEHERFPLDFRLRPLTQATALPATS